MKRPNPELIDDENPKWTEGDFVRMVPSLHCPPNCRHCSRNRALSVPEADKPETHEPAA